MKKYLFILSFFSSFILLSQIKSKEEAYLLFESNSNKTCKGYTEQTLRNKKGVELIKKYRKEISGSRVVFSLCQESFVLDKKQKIDTCNVNFLKKIKFETTESIEKKRFKTKHVNFFKNSVFEKIYLVEILEDKIIKYPVIWNTDLVEK